MNPNFYLIAFISSGVLVEAEIYQDYAVAKKRHGLLLNSPDFCDMSQDDDLVLLSVPGNSETI